MVYIYIKIKSFTLKKFTKEGCMQTLFYGGYGA